MKSKELLLKHLTLNDCKGYITSDGRLYKAIIDALDEAINYAHSSTQLPTEEDINIKANERAIYASQTKASALLSHTLSFKLGADFVKKHLCKNK